MTKSIRKKIITIETLKRTVIRQNSNYPQKIRCEFCQAEVETVTPEFAATILETSVREVYRRIEQDELHFIESRNNSLFICVNSLKTKTTEDK